MQNKFSCLLNTFIVFITSRIFTMISAHFAGLNFFSIPDYLRWDSGHYLSIANVGYTLKKCCIENINYPNCHDWCGNSGWFPFYSYLIKTLTSLGFEDVFAGYMISAIFHFLVIYMIVKFCIEHYNKIQNLIILTALIFFFGNIYYQAIFPISMFLFLIICSFNLIVKGNYFKAAIAGAASVFTYPSGLWLLIVFPVYIFFCCSIRLSIKGLLTSVYTCLILLCGYLPIMIIQKIQVDNWNAFFMVQKTYGHGINIPTKYIKRNIIDLFSNAMTNNFWIEIQTNVVLCMIIIVFTFSIIKNKSLLKMDLLILIYLFIFYLIPLSMGKSLSLYRAESILLPGILLFAKCPKIIQTLLVISMIIISFKMNILFFKAILI
jgi:hypothetical protein